VNDLLIEMFISPPEEVQSIVMSMSVCLFVCSFFHQIVHACRLWPWFGPSLAALRYVMYFRFRGRCHAMVMR